MFHDKCSAIADQRWRVEAQRSGDPRIVRRVDAVVCARMASVCANAYESSLRHAEGEGSLAAQGMRFLMANNCEKKPRPAWILQF